MRAILAVIFQVLLLQKCQGIIQDGEDGVQNLNAQEGECLPLYENLKKYVCSSLMGEVDLSSKYWQLPRDLQSLTISESKNLSLNLANLTSYTKLTDLIIEDSHVTELAINGSVPEQVKVLKFIRSWSHCPEPVSLMTVNCDIQLLELNPKVIYSLRGLEEMHITNCSLSSLIQPELPIKLNISGGSINCLVPDPMKLPSTQRLIDFTWMGDWIKYKNATLEDDVMCFLNLMHFTPHYTFNYISIKKKIEWDQVRQEDCPSECKCPLIGMSMSAKTNDYIPMLEVFCNNASLTKLPNKIPKHTTSIEARYNNITDINVLFDNDLYFSIHKVLVDHNQIKSIDGDKFYDYLMKRNQDFALDLSHNQIEELPVRKIIKAYTLRWKKYSRFIPLLKMTNNPFNCKKCDFLVDFQDILARYSISFAENQEIRCSASSDNLRVLSLDVNSLCAPGEPYLDQIDYINIILALLLLLLFVNFAYNYYQYKTYSKLPWIVTKGPLGMSQG